MMTPKILALISIRKTSEAVLTSLSFSSVKNENPFLKDHTS